MILVLEAEVRTVSGDKSARDAFKEDGLVGPVTRCLDNFHVSNTKLVHR